MPNPNSEMRNPRGAGVPPMRQTPAGVPPRKEVPSEISKGQMIRNTGGIAKAKTVNPVYKSY